MVTIQLALPYIVSDEDRKAPNAWTSTDRTITEWLLKRALDAKLKDGVDRKGDGGTLQRQYMELLEKITLATKGNKDELQVTVEEIRFLNDCLREFKSPPQWLMWTPRLAAHVDKLVRDYEAAEDAKKKAEQEAKKAAAPAEAPKA